MATLQAMFGWDQLMDLGCNVSYVNYRGEGHLPRTAVSSLKPFFYYSSHAYCFRVCLFAACL